MDNGEVLRFTGFYGQTDPSLRQQSWDMLRRVKSKEELNLTDVKTCNGWFTWTINRDGNRLVKERMDRFVFSDVFLEKMPFLTSYIVCRSKFDHEAIMMDTDGSKPKEERTNKSVWFRYDTC
ncbi:hypothetical protein PVK06_027185 [Gossypium arboreum]|uniref:Uncharacterized protein n=1 Tax=Gossypium arboreum TaxID=29729 RepID=A0ABR0P263_GOSAR|nr:hypothetical protein PVK06_027185 [Gossypium arboreum]